MIATLKGHKRHDWLFYADLLLLCDLLRDLDAGFLGDLLLDLDGDFCLDRDRDVLRRLRSLERLLDRDTERLYERLLLRRPRLLLRLRRRRSRDLDRRRCGERDLLLLELELELYKWQ